MVGFRHDVDRHFSTKPHSEKRVNSNLRCVHDAFLMKVDCPGFSCLRTAPQTELAELPGGALFSIKRTTFPKSRDITKTGKHLSSRYVLFGASSRFLSKYSSATLKSANECDADRFYFSVISSQRERDARTRVK